MDLENKMAAVSGKTLLRQGFGGRGGVIEKIGEENNLLIARTLDELGLSKETNAREVREVLQVKLVHLDKELYEILGRPDLGKAADGCEKLCKTVLDLVVHKTGFFIKKEKAIKLLEKYPPRNLLDFFGYKNVGELIEKETFESVFAALRFTQSNDWMHRFFDQAYNDLKPEDFEERPIQLKVLEEKWFNVAEKFLEKKYHNVSHLKEFGIIFIIPLKLDTPGEITRIFTLMLHYLNEVPFYSKLFRKFSQEENFAEKLKSLLRGDVLEGPLLDKGRLTWRIIQRYLAKDNPNDPRLFMPHVNPEAEHWFKAQESLAKLQIKGFARWKELDFAGDYFKKSKLEDKEELVSFDLIDLVMTLVKKGEVKYLYHQQEALWNKIFMEYLGRERMNELIEQNIIKGYIEL